MKQVLNTAPWAYSQVLGDSPVGAGPGPSGGKGGTSEHTEEDTQRRQERSDATGKDERPTPRESPRLDGRSLPHFRDSCHTSHSFIN